MNAQVKLDDVVGWPLPDSFLVELGRVSAIWATLESFLNLCIGKLAGFDVVKDPTPLILITHSSFPQRLDMFETLCEQLLPFAPHLANSKRVISALRSAQQLRNKYMHNGISFDESNGIYHLTIASARGKLKTQLIPVTAQEIRNASKEIQSAMTAMYQMVLVNAPRS